MMYCKSCPNNKSTYCTYDGLPTVNREGCHLDEEYAAEIALLKAKIPYEEWEKEQEELYSEINDGKCIQNVN